jgi:hypothetical protein
MKTAVEWLCERLEEFYGEDFGIEMNLYIQAKQMEKEQIIEAFDAGTNDEDRIGLEYYNETFKSE